jgi:hypothetical protein
MRPLPRRVIQALLFLIALTVLGASLAFTVRQLEVAPRPAPHLGRGGSEEARVLAAALTHLGRSVRVLGVTDSLLGFSEYRHEDSLAQTFAYWRRDYPNLPAPTPELSEAFRTANLTSLPSNARLRLGGRYVSEGTWLAAAQRFAWQLALIGTRPSQEYFSGTVTLSRAGIDPAGERALVAVSLDCSGLCGFGELLALRRGHDGWFVEGSVLLWIA